MRTASNRFLLIALALTAAVGARAEKAKDNALESMTRRIAHELSSLLPSGSPIALEHQASVGDGGVRDQLSAAYGRVLREAILGESSLVLLEGEKIDSILKNIEFQLSGLVDTETSAAVGKLIGAKYLGFSEVAAEPDGYRLEFRVVELETGRIAYEGGGTFAIDGAKEIIRIYAPPSYRLTLGVLGQDLQFANPLSLGASIGLCWFMTPNDELLLNIAASWYLPFNNSYLIANPGTHILPNSDVVSYTDMMNFRYSADARIAYGRCFKPTPFLMLRPQVGAGVHIGKFNNSASWLINGNLTQAGGDWKLQACPYIEAAVSLVLSNDAPLGFFVEVGCQRFLNPMTGSLVIQDLSVSESMDWGFRTLAGVQFHL
jgi:hypothetical protein